MSLQNMAFGWVNGLILISLCRGAVRVKKIIRVFHAGQLVHLRLSPILDNLAGLGSECKSPCKIEFSLLLHEGAVALRLYIEHV